MKTDRNAVVDWHALPKPAVVEPLNYEAILAAIKADFQQRLATQRETTQQGITQDGLALSDNDLSESDPAMKLLEVAAWRELLLRQRINEAARANMLAFAAGSDLDHLAAFYGVMRLQRRNTDLVKNDKNGEKPKEAESNPVNNPSKKIGDVLNNADNKENTTVILESDNALRTRLQAKIAAGSTAGSQDYYRYQALSSDPRVKDVCCDSPASGVVRLSILSWDNEGLPDEVLLNTVRQHVMSDAVRVLTDQVNVVSCVPCVTDIIAEVTLKRDGVAASILTQANTQCRQQLERCQSLGGGLSTSWLIANLFVEGMARLELIAPATDVRVATNGIVIVREIALRCQGVVEC